MPFGDIDWNQVLLKGAIGGVIGAFVGLIMYLTKKKDGTGKPRSDE